MQLLCSYAQRAGLLVPKFNVAAVPLYFIYNMYSMQCCQNLLTRNPKIYEENPGKYIGLMGIDT